MTRLGHLGVDVRDQLPQSRRVADHLQVVLAGHAGRSQRLQMLRREALRRQDLRFECAEWIRQRVLPLYNAQNNRVPWDRPSFFVACHAGCFCRRFSSPYTSADVADTFEHAVGSRVQPLVPSPVC